MITFNDIPLIVPTDQARAWIMSNISPADVYEFERHSWPGPRRTEWALPGFIPDRPIKVGSLFWPRGASRWAVAHFLVEDKYVEQIADLGAFATLHMDDGTNEINPEMWALPPRPLSQFPDFTGHSLLTLVDDRFFWWFKAGQIAVTEGTTTWEDIYDDVAEALEVTIDGSAINAASLKPSGQLSSDYEALPLLLDAIAYNVGHRIVRKPDGTILAQSAEDAATSQTADLQKPWPKLAGGTINAHGLARWLPGMISVMFRKQVVGHPPSGVHRIDATVTDARANDDIVKIFHDDAIAEMATAASTTPNNNSELLNLTVKIGADYLLYQLAKLDIVYCGIRPWVPEGLSDSIEWTITQGTVCTRIQRPPWNDWTEDLNHFTVEENPTYPVRGKLDGTLTAGGSATLSIWHYNGSAEADTGDNITVYDWTGETILSGTEVIAIYDTLSGRYYVDSPPRMLRGKLDGALSFGGSATMSVWYYNGSAEADSGDNITVYDWHLSSGQSVDAGKQGTAWYDVRSGRYYFLGAQC